MEERLIPLFGDDRINKLHNSTVAVIGIGGVGGICAITLARCGINNIIIHMVIILIFSVIFIIANNIVSWKKRKE